MKLLKSKLLFAAAGIAAVVATTSLVFFLLGEADSPFEPNRSFWAKEEVEAEPPLKNDITADVAIIGGGYTGLSTAYHLKKYNPRLKVVLLEAGKVGSGASGRHGGMVLTQPPPESFEISDDSEVHRKTYEITAQNIRKMQAACRASGVDCDLVLDGVVFAIVDEEDVAEARAYAREVREMGMPIEFWDAEETEGNLGTDRYAAALYDPNGGSVHAMKLIRALKTLALRSGVVIYENSKVNEIIEGQVALLKVGAANRRVHAPKVVLATNAFTSKLGYFQFTTIPVHTQTAVTEPLTKEQLKKIGWESRLPFFDSRNALVHVVLREDNRIVIGGGYADYFFRSDLVHRGDMKRLHELTMKELLKIYPELEGIKLEHLWTGPIHMTSDESPKVGITGKYGNIHYGMAYNGQGVNMAFLFGDVIASDIVGRDHPWKSTPYYGRKSGLKGIIPPEPYRWIGAKGMMYYYENEDRRNEGAE